MTGIDQALYRKFLKVLVALDELDHLNDFNAVLESLLSDCDDVNRSTSGETLFRSQGKAQLLVELLGNSTNPRQALKELVANTE